MKTFVCDICGKTTREHELRTLYEKTQQDKVKDMCQECAQELNEVIYKIEAGLKEVKRGWITKVINRMVSKNEKV